MNSVLIVEDMPQAAEALQRDLEQRFPELEILGCANSVVTAAKLIGQQEPDIVLLDIMLGDGTGFDLLDIFPQLGSRVIFITASDEFAIRAFRYAAVDYLLKPVDPDQLEEAVRRAQKRLTGSSESLQLLRDTIRKPAEQLPTRISLSSQERIAVVDIQDIVRCESDGNNTWFVLQSGEKIFVTRTLKQFEQILEKHGFIRVHQTHLVNLAAIREFIKKDGGELRLRNGELIPVSFRKRAEVLAMLGHL